jgi:hypothetical protein
MNKRIHELRDQAIKYAFDNQQSMHGAMDKFAELIIRECMSVADLPKNPTGQWDHLESSEVIAAHFGVEE